MRGGTKASESEVPHTQLEAQLWPGQKMLGFACVLEHRAGKKMRTTDLRGNMVKQLPPVLIHQEKKILVLSWRGEITI